MEFLEALLAIVRAISTDRGEGILEILEENLREYAPFDVGEVIVLGPFGFERHVFSKASFAEEDVLSAARKSGEPLVIGDVRDDEQFALTRGSMKKLGLRSALILPFTGGLVGWIALARDSPWAFSGVRFRILEPLAQLTGLALEKSRSLTQLHGQAMVSPGFGVSADEEKSAPASEAMTPPVTLAGAVEEKAEPVTPPEVVEKSAAPVGSEPMASTEPPTPAPEEKQIPAPLVNEPRTLSEAVQGAPSDPAPAISEPAPRTVPLTRSERRARLRAQALVADGGEKDF